MGMVMLVVVKAIAVVSVAVLMAEPVEEASEH
jgi:hypothetical protein